MKIKLIKYQNKNKLVKLQIIKTKIYKKNIISNLQKKINYTNIKLYIKKIIHLIYEYHINNKKILFINFPKKIYKKLNKNSKNQQHIFIFNEIFLNGIISNQKVNSVYSTKFQQFIKKKLKSNIPIKKLIDLIVIFNPFYNLNSDKTLYISHIPTITINSNFYYNSKQNYKLVGNFKIIERQINNNIFFSILKSIFKQQNIKKNSINKQNIKKIINKRKKYKFLK